MIRFLFTFSLYRIYSQCCGPILRWALWHHVLLLHWTTKGLKPYKCPVCEKAFTQHANMIKHQMLHTGKCGRARCINFVFSILLAHWPIKNTLPTLILRFLSAALTGLKPFKCPVCEKAFTQQANMVKHQMLHTGKLTFLPSFTLLLVIGSNTSTKDTYVVLPMTLAHFLRL